MMKLERCPFCGGEAEVDRCGNRWQAWCRHCATIQMGEFYDTEANAIAAWNRRAEDERYKNALKEIIKLACESVEREKTLARLEAEVMARLEERHETD